MATYYIDPTWGGTKSGTFALPWSTYASLPALSAGDMVLLKQGTTFSGIVAVGYSGTSGNPIIYGVYNSTTGARVTATVGAATIAGDAVSLYVYSTGGQSFVEVECMVFSNLASSGYGCRLGSNSTGSTDGNVARYCTVTNQTCAAGLLLFGNLGTVGHTIDRCVSSNNSAFGILQASSGSPVAGRITVTNNVCNYNGQSGFRSAFSAATLVSGRVANNDFSYNGTVAPASGKGMGIDVLSNSAALAIQNNTCSNNYIIGIRSGSFSGTSTANQTTIASNTCNYNGEHGIQIVSSGGWIAVNNTCNYNGANRGNFYGRGIEIYGGSTTPAGPGIVCFNKCSYNYNYGGTTNNGTEGVGIGLDDYHKDVTVFSNLVTNNEGNGIQWNPNGAAGTSRVYGNILIDNFTAPLVRANPWQNYLKAQACTYTTENNVNFYNNTIILTQANAPACLYGFSETDIAAGTNTVVCNNLLKGHGVALRIRPAITRTNNGFYGNTVNVQANTSTTTQTDGTGAVTVDPQLDSSYRPGTAAYRNAGVALGGRDYNGQALNPVPSIGAVEALAAILRYTLKTP